jgi:tripartite-type tricarboxylate transporter receptor subunit TctC
VERSYNLDCKLYFDKETNMFNLVKFLKHTLALCLAVNVSMASAGSATAPTQAPAIPNELRVKTITLVVPYATGGETDITQRFIAAQIEKTTGLNVVVVNKLGGSGVVAAREVASSRPDGLTLFGHDNGTHVVQPAVNFPNAVNRKSLEPITVFAITPLFMYTGANSEFKTVADVINKARNNPKFTIGVSAAPHTLMSHGDFWSGAKVAKPYYVVFKGAADVAISASNRDVDVFMTTSATAVSFVQAGKIRPLGVAWPETLSVHPDAPSLNRWVKDFKAYNIQMVSAPVGTPPHLVKFYNELWRFAANTAESRQRWKDLSVVHRDMNLRQTQEFLETEYTQAVRRSVVMPQLDK